MNGVKRAILLYITSILHRINILDMVKYHFIMLNREVIIQDR